VKSWRRKMGKKEKMGECTRKTYPNKKAKVYI
jgi:hypothetical protein